MYNMKTAKELVDKIRGGEDETIKPCPFCGGKAEINLGDFGERYVTCADDNCGGRLGSGIWFTSEIDAVRVWNRRAAGAV
jgi:hypothetical protein